MKEKKPIFPQKATIVIMLKDGITIAGKGSVQATKDTKGQYIFTATLVKDY